MTSPLSVLSGSTNASMAERHDDMQEIRFTVPGAPVGKGRPRIIKIAGHSRMKTPEKTASYENLVALSAQKAMAGAAPLEQAVEVELLLQVAPPTSWPNKKRIDAHAGLIRPTTKPDIDNVLKAIADACNGIVWIDDKQITDVIVRKRYDAVPGAQVIVRAAA